MSNPDKEESSWYSRFAWLEQHFARLGERRRPEDIILGIKPSERAILEFISDPSGVVAEEIEWDEKYNGGVLKELTDSEIARQEDNGEINIIKRPDPFYRTAVDVFARAFRYHMTGIGQPLFSMDTSVVQDLIQIRNRQGYLLDSDPAGIMYIKQDGFSIALLGEMGTRWTNSVDGEAFIRGAADANFLIQKSRPRSQ